MLCCNCSALADLFKASAEEAKSNTFSKYSFNSTDNQFLDKIDNFFCTVKITLLD
ncbi:MAG: hypothetical protein OFPI_22260 [Osedax symbiont Rs2]|nr:MAG: hypothetical protein OFPI_22260 [Osedax symbiont Rs2]